VELVYEGEVEGIAGVATLLIGKAIRKMFAEIFPNPDKVKKSKTKNPYAEIINWFNEGNTVDILQNCAQQEYETQLYGVNGLQELVKSFFPKSPKQDQLFMMEFTLHGLSEFSQLSKHKLETGIQFKDLLGSMMNLGSVEEDGDEAQFN
jgi:magnesium chelatase subunit I